MAADKRDPKKPSRSSKASARKPAKRASAAAGKAKPAAPASARKPAKKAPAATAKSVKSAPAGKSRSAGAKSASAAAKEPAAGASAAAKKPARRASATAKKPASAKKPSKAARPAARKPAAVPAARGESASSAEATYPSKRAMVEQTVRGYFEALAVRDADAAMRAWHEDAVDDVVPIGIFRGPAAIRALLEEMIAAMPDARFTFDRIIADDRAASVQWRISGTFTGEPFQGLEASGRRVDLRGSDCLEVVDGKIVHNTGVFDGAAFARQIGLLPPEDSGADRAIRAGFNIVTKVRRTVSGGTTR